MSKQKDLFNTILLALQKSGDTALAWKFQHDMILAEYYERQEREQLIDEITQNVLSRLNATVDISEVIDAIDGLNDKIDSLERK